MKTVAVLLCGGSSNRMRGKVTDKVLVELRGRPVFDYSVSEFEKLGGITSYTIVYRDGPQKSQLSTLVEPLTSKPITWVQGGEERQVSVLNALEATSVDTEFVMIHDCARPLIRAEALEDVYAAMIRDKSAVLSHHVVDTIKQVSAKTSSARQAELENLDRKRLWAMETPQAFSYKLILGAYRKLNDENLKVTDDTAAVIHYGYRVTLVENTYPNPKITHPEDLAMAELLLQHRQQES